MKSLLHRLVSRRIRETQLVGAVLRSWGPTARSLPPDLRAALVRSRAVRRLPRVRHRRFGRPELVRLRDVGAGARTRVMARPWIAVLPQARLVARQATPVTAEGRVLPSPYLFNVSSIHAVDDAELARPQEVSGFVPLDADLRGRPLLSLVGRLDSNYFHWIADFLPQLEALERCALATERPGLLVRAEAPPFVRASLRLLGWEDEDLVTWPLGWSAEDAGGRARVRLDVDRLLVASPRGSVGVPSLRSLRWVRRMLLAGAGVEPRSTGRRLYVQRGPAAWRGIANEDEVLRVVATRGFERVMPETLELAEQLRLFASAEHVVGLHGAGLTNLLFSPRAALVEVAGSYGSSEFAAVAQAVGSRHVVVRGRDRQEDRVEVPLDVLEAALDDVGAGR